MNRMRPEYLRQSSSGGTPGAPGSPTTSPITRHMRSGSMNVGQMRKTQTKAAAQRLAAMMAQQNDDDDDGDELVSDYNVSGAGSFGRRSARAIRPRSPMTKNIGQKHMPLVMSQQQSNENCDEDDLLVSGPASIGLSGRAVRPRSPMTKTPVQKRMPQVMTQQQADKDTDEDNLLVSGKPSIGLAGGRSMRARSPMTKSTAQRGVQQVMPEQPGDEDNAEDDLSHDNSSLGGMVSIGRASGRTRLPSSVSVCTSHEQPPYARSMSGARFSSSVNSAEQPSSDHLAPAWKSSSTVEQPLSACSTSAGPKTQSHSVEQPLSTQSAVAGQSTQINSVEQPSSACFMVAGRPNLKVKTVPMVPASVPISLKYTSTVNPSEIPNDQRDKRLSVDLRNISYLKERGSQNSASTLQDELDMLQEENESLLEKLRLVEERCEEAEARARQLEKQVATLGEGVTLEARLLSRKEAALQQREAALRVAAQNSSVPDSEEIDNLRTEAETARDEAISALEQLHEAECEVKSLRNLNQRMKLSREEMEEVVLKRCWLAHYWSLCLQHGLHTDIAAARFEYWSSMAPLADEIVLDAGQKAKEDKLSSNNETSGEGNVESMLIVDKGLRELASLKVEDAVALAMAQNRHSNSIKFDDVKLPTEGQFEAFELSQEETEDVRFKQGWLTYFWRRAKMHGVEPDIVDERLQFWINQSSRSSSSHDAVEVERGLMELRKLSLEYELWQKSRQGLELELTATKSQTDSDF